MSIPTVYRQELHEDAARPPFLTAYDDHLRLYPSEDWCRYEEEILAEAQVDPDAQDYVRMVISNAVEAPIDKQGRILVPQYLREIAGLEKEVTIAGAGAVVEIWDAARYRMHFGQVQSNFREISRNFDAKRRARKAI